MTGGRRVTVLLSGTGRSLANLIARTHSGHLDCEFVRVISSRASARGIEVAEKSRIATAVVDRKRFPDAESHGRALTEAIERDAPDLVVMAGFLSHWALPDRFLGRVINIHPSLLPLFGGKGFYGDRVHEAVLSSGMRVSGCTVHWVDERYDHGAPILQLACPVLPDDDVGRLAARVFARECEALPRAIDWCLSGRVRLEEGRACFAPGFDATSMR